VPRLLEFASRFKRVAIVCHPNADPDCIGSAFALQEYLKKKCRGMEITILALDGVNTVTDRLLAYLSLRVEDALPPSVDLFILVDLSSLDQIPSIKEAIAAGIPFAILDHHVPDSSTIERAALAMVKERPSTCEVVFEAVGGMALSKMALNALLAGLIYDSRRFLNSPQLSIKSAYKMIELGADPARAMALLASDEDPSERMAKLKGAARLRLYRADAYNIAITNVGSFEATVARALTNLGADLALAVAENGKNIRISARSTEAFHRSSGLNLARDVMHPLAAALSGHGGGHPTAASVNAKCDGESMISSTLELISKKLGSQLKEINTKK
jgi:nanoRNase/pAp phosphatase (c-di-AMP/oligoRNAs hydrolase)